MKRLTKEEKFSIICDIGILESKAIIEKYHITYPTLASITKRYGHWEYVMDTDPRK